jgi:2-polyprenyl-3-methyl-5-hydroxy-6-metoxy-1,4-benzoquinol methylase
MKNHYDVAICPLCQGENLVGLNWHQRDSNYRLDCCSDCSFHFTQPRPNAEFLSDYYDKISSVRFFKQTDDDSIKEVQKLIRLVNKYHSKAKKVLELGCSTGYLLNGLKLCGYDVVGTDLSTSASKLAEVWYGVDVYVDEFPPESFVGQFDVVIINHVIEHVINPKAFIHKAVEYLNSGGLLLIETPNINSAGIRLFKGHYPVICPPGHLNFFSPETISKTLSADMLVLNIYTSDNDKGTVYNMFNSLASVFRFKRLIDLLISKREEIKDIDGVAVNNSTNRKYKFMRFFLKISWVVELLLFPIFIPLNFYKYGENLNIVSIKKDRSH